jgi:hypothetical protein
MTTTHRISTAAVLILSLAAAGAPGAYADTTSAVTPTPAAVYSRQDKSMVAPPPAAVYSRQDKSIVAATSPSNTAGSTAKPSAAPPPVVRIEAAGNGFDWGDAGIGAASGLALSLIGLGGVLAVSQHRTRRTHNTA